ncbi:GAF domain-containing protein [Inhella proteolytica]|uniref:GAF domain-containing protein n=1 Tax=Inhella proteolytica TaxID=2795029 RepID=A0A931NH69_9BURK|nr:GAF domain-containing protein [Inhella proteolytica]MBH9576200.1 GAF domain-containing protein [Inhella proteolytica]
MNALDLDAIRPCLEGAIPGVIATCGGDGVPNVTYVSQVEYVGARQLALSFQFFNKTRRNVLANPQVELLVVHPAHGATYRIGARFLRTESEGPLFERMKAKLAGIASHTGMAEVFRLRGADLYAVDSVTEVAAPRGPAAAPAPSPLSSLRRASERLAACTDFDALVETLLDAVVQEFGLPHAQLLVWEPSRERLVTLASRGYGRSGVGAEIPLGEGVIGVAARTGSPIRINHATLEYAYARRVREGLDPAQLGREIPLPGLAEPGSQLALPLQTGGQLQGVLFVESPEELRLSWDDEDALVALAGQAAALVRALQPQSDEEGAAPPLAQPADCPLGGEPLRVRYYAADSSVFLDDEYLIKGVAGAVLWKLLRLHHEAGRCEFSNRELRLDPELGLPEVGDNLEARLLLLTRRLAERQACVRLERCGRGRLRLLVERPLQLQGVGR